MALSETTAGLPDGDGYTYTVVVTTEGSGVPAGLTIEFWSRGGSDRETEGSGSETIGCGVTVGSERTEEVLVSPECQITSALANPYIHTSTDHSRLIANPLARAAKRMEDTITLENMIFEEKVVKWRKKKGNQA